MKPYCHPNKIVFSITGDPMFSCGDCKRDQTGFLGFLWGVAQHSENPEAVLGGKKKKKGWACKNCGEPGHRQKTCTKPRATEEARTDEAEESERENQTL